MAGRSLQGTKRAPVFQRMMQDVLGTLIDNGVVCYLDDTLGCAETLEELAVLMRKVFTLLRQHKLYAKLSKCVFGATEVQFLGYKVNGQGIRTDESKITAVQNWPEPDTVSDVRRRPLCSRGRPWRASPLPMGSSSIVQINYLLQPIRTALPKWRSTPYAVTESILAEDGAGAVADRAGAHSLNYPGFCRISGHGIPRIVGFQLNSIELNSIELAMKT